MNKRTEPPRQENVLNLARWVHKAEREGCGIDRPSRERPRVDLHPTQQKLRWERSA